MIVHCSEAAPHRGTIDLVLLFLYWPNKDVGDPDMGDQKRVGFSISAGDQGVRRVVGISSGVRICSVYHAASRERGHEVHQWTGFFPL